MSEIVTIERVGKFGPMIEGKWVGLKKPLKPSDFVAGETYEIETEAWESKGKSGINITSRKFAKVKNFSEEKKEKEVSQTVSSAKAAVSHVSSYSENKDNRILVQGLTQAAMTSPALAGLPYTNLTELEANAKAFAKAMIEFVREEAKQ